MKSVYADQERVQRSIDGFQRDIRQGFSGYKVNPGNKLSLVLELISADRVCIFAKVQRDFWL